MEFQFWVIKLVSVPPGTGLCPIMTQFQLFLFSWISPQLFCFVLFVRFHIPNQEEMFQTHQKNPLHRRHGAFFSSRRLMSHALMTSRMSLGGGAWHLAHFTSHAVDITVYLRLIKCSGAVSALRSRGSWTKRWTTCLSVCSPWRTGWATWSSCPPKVSPRAKSWTESKSTRPSVSLDPSLTLTDHLTWIIHFK